MSSGYLLIPILLPIVAGLVFAAAGGRMARIRHWLVSSVILLTSAAALLCVFFCREEAFNLFNLFGSLSLTLHFDGAGRFFTGLIAVLWPITTFYAFGYMKAEKHHTLFYTFFIMSYGVTLGIAMSGNLLTMYCFYELLTLTTMPLVMHPLTKKAIKAAMTYLIFSIGGAAFAFITLVFLASNGVDLSFIAGGNVAAAGLDGGMCRAFYVVTFLGFGVKAAIFPLHKWLPDAAVAPTPVTALLHAVAVVKAGAFAIIRLTYYVFGTELMAGTWAQYVPMGLAAFTILMGSYIALKERHWKRRMAYSTVSNLSYVVFGATIMTKAGLIGALMHLIFHAVAKILAFFCVGAVKNNTHREYTMQLEGLGRKMPITFACFTVAALSLTGIPPLCGFFSKWSLLTAALSEGSVMSLIGVGVLLISAFLTAMYTMTTVVRAFFPGKNADLSGLDSVKEVPKIMWVPMALTALIVIALGLCSGPFAKLAAAIAVGAM